ncbi:HYR domain-containing protein, partial [Psychroserpens sp. AS72]|uniref:HYR domain-containing protein n=1 Tax=Psychroserpens sp. AS72 TaxID=3135775 RepID=UPI0031702FA3
FVVTDASGNTATCSFDVTVVDNENPTIACPGDITQDTDLGICGAIVTYSVTSADNCPGQTITQTAGIASGSQFPVGTTTNTFLVTDDSGNTATCSFDVTVNDTEAPIVDCLSLQVQLDEFGNGTISENDINGNSTDNCGIASISLSQTTFDCSDIGGDLDALIISEYVDGNNNDDCIEIFNGTGNDINLNAGNYTLNFYIDGSSTPTYTVPLLGVIADREVYVVCNPFTPNADVVANQTGAFGIDGNDAIALVSNGNAVDIIGEIGIDPGTGWSSGSVSTSGTTLVRNLDVLQGNINTFVANLATEWSSYPQNTFSQLGAHEIEITELANNVILTVTDTSGNVSTCEGNVTILDVTPPEPICQNVTVELDANGNGSTTASAVDNGSNDACGIASLSLSVTDFTCNDIGDNPVVLMVTDSNGNTSTCTATVTVVDNVNPIVLTQDITVQLDANGTAIISANNINDGSSDNCEILNISVSPSTFDCSNVGVNTVTLTVEDVNGNSATETATVIVEDNVSPTVSCSPITVELDSTGNYALTQSDIDAIADGSNDACGIESLSVTPNSFTCDEIGSNTVTLTLTDSNGNTASCTTTVTVEGIIPDVTIIESPLPEFCQGAVLVLTAETTTVSGQTDSDISSYLWNTGENTKSIEVPGNGTYGVIITSQTNCDRYFEYEVTGFDPGNLISAYTILATDEVHLQNNNLVQSGGVGVIGVGKKIKVHNASNIVDFAQASQIQINGGSSVGTVVYSPANPIIPSFVYNIQSNSESPNVTINNNATVTLSETVYGKITIKNGGTAIFTEPNVHIDELTTENNTIIEFSGCTNVLINKKLNFGNNSIFNSDGNMVTVYVNNQVDINKGSLIVARIHANDNNIDVKGNNGTPTYLTGLFIGKNIKGNKNVIWNSDTFCSPCPAPNDGSLCSDSAEIPLPFVFEGVGEFCWETSGVINFINSWSLQSLEINGVNYTNQYTTIMPDRIDGKYYIRYVSNFDWGHFEINGFEDNEDTGLGCEDPIEIAVPYVFDGTDEYCWETTDDIDIVNSWSLESLEINGQDFTNMYSTNLPAKIGGKYYIRYTSNYPWGHVELQNSSSRIGLFEVKSWPNPSDSEFNLRLITDNIYDKAEIKVFDLNNKLVHSSEFYPDRTYKFGKELQGGVYIIKVIQDGKLATERLVKY